MYVCVIQWRVQDLNKFAKGEGYNKKMKELKEREDFAASISVFVDWGCYSREEKKKQ